MAGITSIQITCPKCYGGTVHIAYYPGHPGRWMDSNGDGEPPEPESIEEIAATCDCWPDGEVVAALSGVEYPTWLCESRVVSGAGRGNHGDICISWNRKNYTCENCGASEPPNARQGTGFEAHPVYAALIELVHAFTAISDYYTAEALDKAMPEVRDMADDREWHEHGKDVEMFGRTAMAERGELPDCGLPNCWTHGTERPPVICPNAWPQ